MHFNFDFKMSTRSWALVSVLAFVASADLHAQTETESELAPPASFVQDPSKSIPPEISQRLESLLRSHQATTQQEILIFIEAPIESQKKDDLRAIAKLRLNSTLKSEDGVENNYFGRGAVVVFPKFKKVLIERNYGLSAILDEATLETLIEDIFEKSVPKKSIWGALELLTRELILKLNSIAEAPAPLAINEQSHTGMNTVINASRGFVVGSWFVLLALFSFCVIFLLYVLYFTRFHDEIYGVEGKQELGARHRMREWIRILKNKRTRSQDWESIDGCF